MRYVTTILAAFAWCAIALPSPQQTTTAPTAGVRLLPIPIHPITITNITIPLGGSAIAKWSYYQDQNCQSYIADIEAYESDLNVCKPLLGNSILFEYLLQDDDTHFPNSIEMVACLAKDCQKFANEPFYGLMSTAFCIDVHDKPSYSLSWSL